MDEQMAELRFGPDGLVPAVIQDADDGTVLMLVELNREALSRTLQTGWPHAWSRAQQGLYKLGEDSEQVWDIAAIKYNRDGDTLLIQVRCVPGGGGQRSHFAHSLQTPSIAEVGLAQLSVTEMPAALYDLILRRRESGDEQSYVRGLFRRGQDVICKKVVEEAAEVLIASKNQVPDEIVYEMADLWFHATVLLGYHTIHPHAVWRELRRRFGQPGGGKASAAQRPAAVPETFSG
jgi:phosphoribosyl-ATP pyrophosphohydrolase/phosphoribosyl-AMP cyclohydrolase